MLIIDNRVDYFIINNIISHKFKLRVKLLRVRLSDKRPLKLIPFRTRRPFGMKLKQMRYSSNRPFLVKLQTLKNILSLRIPKER